MLDEVEQAVVGVVRVVDDPGRSTRPRWRDRRSNQDSHALNRSSAGSVPLAPERPSRLASAGSEPASLGLVRDVGLEGARQLVRG